MKTSEIKNILMSRGYEERSANILAEDLANVSKELKSCLDVWLESGEETDYEDNGFSIIRLKNKYGMKYPAALLSIDWVIKDPKNAVPAIKRGVR